jgi:hypothetical protein
LVCDFAELYRYLVEDFIIQYCQKVKVKDFVVKEEVLTKNKKGKRQCLNEEKTNSFSDELNEYLIHM